LVFVVLGLALVLLATVAVAAFSQGAKTPPRPAAGFTMGFTMGASALGLLGASLIAYGWRRSPATLWAVVAALCAFILLVILLVALAVILHDVGLLP
jgi:hypothetical protein